MQKLQMEFDMDYDDLVLHAIDVQKCGETFLKLRAFNKELTKIAGTLVIISIISFITYAVFDNPHIITLSLSVIITSTLGILLISMYQAWHLGPKIKKIFNVYKTAHNQLVNKITYAEEVVQNETDVEAFAKVGGAKGIMQITWEEVMADTGDD